MCEHCNDDHRDNECSEGLCPSCCGILCHHEPKPKMKRKLKKFSKELIAEYGEQTYRDYKTRRDAYRKYGAAKGNGNFPNKRPTYEDAAWSSVYVAWGCGLIEEKDHNRFLKAIVKHAKTTKWPKNFI